MLRNCRLYVIIDKDIARTRDMAKIAENALRGGADIIQLRDKSSSDSRLLQYARSISDIAKKYNRPFIVNDRVDIARAVSADGVHLGQDDIPIKDARRIIGNKIIGLSSHSAAQAKAAQKNGADYIGIGPIFKTSTKEYSRPIGTSVLGEIRNIIDIPFFAIGGISLVNIEAVKRAGADRVALVSAATKTENVHGSVKRLKEAMEA